MIYSFLSTDTDFNTNGEKILHPYYAEIYKEDNGDYYIEIEAPISEFEYLLEGAIVAADTPWGRQGFRLRSPTKTARRVKVKGWHLFYDSANYLINSLELEERGCNDALDAINNATDTESPFTVISNIESTNSLSLLNTTLEEAINEVVETWGGHLSRDNWDIGIYDTLGEDRGVTIDYGKNIEAIEISEDWDDVCTKILPVGKDDITLDDLWVTSNTQYDIPYSKVIQFDQELDSDDYDDDDEYLEALKADLQAQAESYLEEYSEPKLNYTVNAYLKDVSDVGDTIRVHHPKCDVDITTNVISIKYDCIAERYTEIEFGNFKPKLSTLRSDLYGDIEDSVATQSEAVRIRLQEELEAATSNIWSALGDSYVIYEENRILIVDALPKEDATNVILIDSAGIGFSTTGIDGTFTTAWEIDGTFNAQVANVINFTADLISGGTLKLGGTTNTNGLIEVYNSSNTLIAALDKDGLIFYNQDGSYVVMSGEEFAGYDSDGNRVFWADWDEFHMTKGYAEEEFTFIDSIRILQMTTDDDEGIGFVAVSD